MLPVGDFAWYDQVLTHSLTFGVIPERFRAHGEAGPTLHTLFGMARGVSDDSCCGGAHAQEMTKWFDTNYHYLVPEFSADQQFQLSWEQLFEEVDEARALGHQVKPVLIGPLTYLWLGKAKGAEFDRLDLLDRLLPLYGQILRRLAGQGVEWVQIDEPILVLDLPQAWKNAFERAYNLLQSEPLKKLVATYFGGLEDNLGLAANLPVDGLHIDLVRAPEQYPSILDRLPAYKVVLAGPGQRTQRLALRPGESPGSGAPCPGAPGRAAVGRAVLLAAAQPGGPGARRRAGRRAEELAGLRRAEVPRSRGAGPCRH